MLTYYSKITEERMLSLNPKKPPSVHFNQVVLVFLLRLVMNSNTSVYSSLCTLPAVYAYISIYSVRSHLEQGLHTFKNCEGFPYVQQTPVRLETSGAHTMLGPIVQYT